MLVLRNTLNEFIGRQQRRPDGLIGRMIGEQMVRQHAAETAWTISLLEIKSDDHILEIGFGAGRAIELAVSQATNVHVTGIDLSQTMVQAASRRNAQTIKSGRVELRQGDAMTLPFADEQFDKIMSIHTFYFWPEPLSTLSEIFRVLKPAGKLAITLSTGKEGSTEASGLEHYQEVLDAEILPAMRRLGFVQAYLEQGPTARQFRSVAVVGVK